MKGRMLSLALALILCIGLLPADANAAQDDGVTVSFLTAVYSVSKEAFIREASESDSLDQCGEDEYLTLCIIVKNTSGQTAALQDLSVRIDGGKELRWTGSLSLEPGKSGRLHVYRGNEEYLTPGLHTAVFYANGKALYSGRFSIGRAWSEIFRLPTEAQIAARPTDARSPYVYTWLSNGSDVRYDAYCVDFKSDHIPNGAYSSVFNGYLDFSSLKGQYESVDTQGTVSLYCGLELWEEGKESDVFFRMWDIQCKDKDGNLTVIRPKQIYPEEAGGTFSHEGTGVDSRIPYDWKEGRWYRMLLRCGASETTGNTTIEQWLQDLTTNKWTHICTYDTGVKDSGFIGHMALFTENFFEQYAGEVRSLEFANVRIHTDKGWQDVTSTNTIRTQTTGSHTNAYGSWEAGADGNTFYMIATGVSGWGRTENTGALAVRNRESGDPLAEKLPRDPVQFTDVPASAYYAEAVAWAVERGITSGTSKTTFSPNATCTQAQILTFLWLANGSPEPAGAVSGSQYYAAAVQWAAEKALAEKTLSPNAPCTRADVVDYLWKLSGSPAPSGQAGFTDVPARSDSANAVAWAVEQGITSGTGKTTFSPEGVCTRGQIVTFLYRALAE